MYRYIIAGLLLISLRLGNAQQAQSTSPARELFYSVFVKKDPVPTQKTASAAK